MHKMHSKNGHHIDHFWSSATAKFSQKKIEKKIFNDPQAVIIKNLCALSLAYNSTTPLSAVFVWGFKFTNWQLDRKI